MFASQCDSIILVHALYESTHFARRKVQLAVDLADYWSLRQIRESLWKRQTYSTEQCSF